MTKPLTISELADRCRAEAERYRHSGRSDETYCFALFYHALNEQNEDAWQAIYIQYSALAAAWVYRYSRFSQTDEEAGFFVNEAFARMWQSASRPDRAKQLNSLGKCLEYLRLCAGSAIEDYLRKADKDALRRSIPLENHARSIPTPDIDQKLQHDRLQTIVWETVQDEAERLVAAGSWVYGLAPRQIQARHPDVFATTKAVNQTKRNLLKRLRRRVDKEMGEGGDW